MTPCCPLTLDPIEGPFAVSILGESPTVYQPAALMAYFQNAKAVSPHSRTYVEICDILLHRMQTPGYDPKKGVGVLFVQHELLSRLAAGPRTARWIDDVLALYDDSSLSIDIPIPFPPSMVPTSFADDEVLLPRREKRLTLLAWLALCGHAEAVETVLPRCDVNATWFWEFPRQGHRWLDGNYGDEDSDRTSALNVLLHNSFGAPNLRMAERLFCAGARVRIMDWEAALFRPSARMAHRIFFFLVPNSDDPECVNVMNVGSKETILDQVFDSCIPGDTDLEEEHRVRICNFLLAQDEHRELDEITGWGVRVLSACFFTTFSRSRWLGVAEKLIGMGARIDGEMIDRCLQERHIARVDESVRCFLLQRCPASAFSECVQLPLVQACRLKLSLRCIALIAERLLPVDLERNCNALFSVTNSGVFAGAVEKALRRALQARLRHIRSERRALMHFG